MQAINIADLQIHLAVGGIDQRKIHMLAREELPRLGLPAPVCMHTPLIPGLNGEKMSSSKGDNIAVDEPAADVEKKIKSAFCPAKVVENNPVLAICKYHIFPRIEVGNYHQEAGRSSAGMCSDLLYARTAAGADGCGACRWMTDSPSRRPGQSAYESHWGRWRKI